MKFVKLTARNNKIIYINLAKVYEIFRNKDIKGKEFTVLFGTEPGDYEI